MLSQNQTFNINILYSDDVSKEIAQLLVDLHKKFKT